MSKGVWCSSMPPGCPGTIEEGEKAGRMWQEGGENGKRWIIPAHGMDKGYEQEIMVYVFYKFILLSFHHI